MPRDLYEEAGVQPAPRDLYAERGIKSEPVDTSIGARVGRFAYGLARGSKDVLDAGAQMLTRAGEMLPGAAGEYMADERRRVEEMNRQGEKQYEASRKGVDGIDWGRMGGNIIATAPIATVIPGAGAATLAGRVAYGAGTGALAGAFQPVQVHERKLSDLITGDETPNTNFWAEKAQQIGLGGLTGGALAGAAHGVNRVFNPQTTPEAQMLVNEGVRVLPGQRAGGWLARAEDKMSSLVPSIRERQVDALGDFGIATVNRALTPIGARVPQGVQPGREAVAFMHDAVEGAYTRLLRGMSFQADNTLVQNLGSLRQLANNMHPDRARQFDNILSSQFLSKLNPNTGVMSGETFNRAQSEIGRLARGFMHSADADQRELGRALWQAHDELLSGIARTNPQRAAQFSAVRSAAADAMRIDHAAASLGAEGGRFTGAHLTNAVKRMDPTMRKNAFAEGSARGQDWAEAGKNVLGSKYPDSGTAGRLFQGAGVLGALSGAVTPQAIGAYLAGSALYSRPGMQLLDAALYAGGPTRQAIARALQDRAALAAPALAPGFPGVPQ